MVKQEIMLKYILVNYNFTPDWAKDKDYIIYDRSDSKEWLKAFDQSRIVYTENIGQIDFDKLNYLIDNYDQLPDVFLWGKSNIFKYIDEIPDVKGFTPLLKQDHKTYSDSEGQVCYYEDGMYYERNNNWYVAQFRCKYFMHYGDWAKEFNLPNPKFLPFAPGGNYILTKEVVHKYPKEFYARMAEILPYCAEPAEAQMAERSYFNMWS